MQEMQEIEKETALSAPIDPLARARALRPLVESEADAADADLTLTKPVLDALARASLFQLMVPGEWGGLESDTDVLLDVFEELSHQDGSIGWTHMANVAGTAYAAFLDPKLGEAMLKDRPDSVFGGQFAPVGQVARAGDDFRVSGHFQFGSGSSHSSYVGGAGMLMADETTPEMLQSGMPAFLCFFVPHETVLFQGGWDVMGLRGTGSYDYEIPEQVVDRGYTFYLFDAKVRTGGPLYGLGPIAIAGLGHAGWGLGVAQRALDEITEIAGGRTRMGAALLRDQPVFQRELGEQCLALQSVRLLVHDVFGRAVDRIAAGNPLDKAAADEIMAAVAYMTQVAESATLFAYRASGSQGLRNPSLVQRCFRDMLTGGLHIYVDRRSYDELAKGKLGL